MRNNLIWITALAFLLSAGRAAAQDTAGVRVFPQAGAIFFSALSPDDHTVALWENAVFLNDDPAPALRTIRLLDIETGGERALIGASDYANDVAFTSDGAIMASIHRNGDVILWDMATARPINIRSYLTPLSIAQFLGDDRTLIALTSSTVGLFLYIDTESGAITRITGRRFAQFQEFVNNYVTPPQSFSLSYAAFDLMPTGERLIASNINGDLLLFEDEPGIPTVLLPAPEGAFGRFNIRTLYWADDESHITYYDSDREAIVRLSPLLTETTIAGGIHGFALAPDGNRVAWIDREKNIVRLSAFDMPESSREIFTLPDHLRARIPVMMAFTSDGSSLVIGGLASSNGQNAIYVIDMPS
jgi:WD40 repeat protein